MVTQTSPISPVVVDHELPLPKETKENRCVHQRESKHDSQWNTSIDSNMEQYGPGDCGKFGILERLCRLGFLFPDSAEDFSEKKVSLAIPITGGSRGRRFSLQHRDEWRKMASSLILDWTLFRYDVIVNDVYLLWWCHGPLQLSIRLLSLTHEFSTRDSRDACSPPGFSVWPTAAFVNYVYTTKITK